MNNIGKRIKELRKKKDMTQERLADLLGVTDRAVSKWECGMTMPDLSLILPLTKILGVSADELLGGKPGAADARRAELDARCDHFLKYDMKENYRLAQQAVREFPRDYRYLSWLARMEMSMAYDPEFKEDPSAPYSAEMLELAIKHSDIVIEECQDAGTRNEAIWNAMACFKNMDRYDEAQNYAQMIPEAGPYTRDGAMEMCLQGQELTEYRKWIAYKKLSAFCISLSRIYWFAERREACVTDALDTEEAILRAAIPDGNYLEFHRNLCCAYQKRAEFAVAEGNYDQAMEDLRTMMEHAESVPRGNKKFTCGALAGLAVELTQNNLLYIMTGLDDLNKPLPEQAKHRIMTLEIFAPLWEREDFRALCR